MRPSQNIFAATPTAEYILICVGSAFISVKKTMKRSYLAPACANALESFMQEIETMGSLTHPHVVRETDAGEASGP